MKTVTTIILITLLLALPSMTPAATVGDAVTVEILTDRGRSLPLYPANSDSNSHRVYAEAVKGEQFRIIIHNRLSRRVGVVIAVDGRNIVSGKKSWLGNSERMYILEPHGIGEYAGWRSGNDRINRFYFTTPGDSYAGAFRDESAMGVIAVTAYSEYQPPEEPQAELRSMLNMKRSAEAGAVAPSPAKRSKSTARILSESDQAGTGYGQEEYSPSRVVAFTPESSPLAKILIKYEWRETLCRIGVIRCNKPQQQQRNRLWYHDGFAPPPPGRG